jgi:uncharacterized protein (DUF2225 family)
MAPKKKTLKKKNITPKKKTHVEVDDEECSPKKTELIRTAFKKHPTYDKDKMLLYMLSGCDESSNTFKKQKESMRVLIGRVHGELDKITPNK